MASATAMPAISVAGWCRIVARIAAMILLFVTVVPCFYLWRFLGIRNPWPRWFMQGILRLSGIRLRITGHRSKGAEFLLPNHVSWIDIPAISAASGAAFVGHDGLGKMPFIRWLCSMNGTVLVARHNRTDVQDQIGRIRLAMAKTGALVIFPEGTTGSGEGLLPFKSALMSALDPVPDGIAVQPVLLDYGPQVSRIAWVGDEHGLTNFKRLLARHQPITLNAHFLPPLTGQALANRKAIASAARVALLHEMEVRRGQRVAL